MESLEHYRISKRTGFLLEDPLTRLRDDYRPWQELLDNLSSLLQSCQLRHAVDTIPLLTGSDLLNHREIRLAHLTVAMLSSAYVWQNGESGVAKVLPNKLAVPLYNLSAKLGVPPIIGHTDLVLANTLFLTENMEDVTNPMEDFELIAKFTSDSNWDSFFLITSLIEFKFAAAIPHVMEAVRLSSTTGGTQLLADHLTATSKVVATLQEAMTLFHKHLNPETFYNGIRPFLNGWSGSSAALPKGLIYQGVSDVPICCQGGSAAQSPTLQTLDMLVGNRHPKERQMFLEEMRDYMIKEHRQFLMDLEKNSKVREKVLASKDSCLTEAYNGLATAIEKFRTYHISIVTKFIIIPSRCQKNDFESLKSKGTGGQDLIHFLKDIRDSTRDGKVLKD